MLINDDSYIKPSELEILWEYLIKHLSERIIFESANRLTFIIKHVKFKLLVFILFIPKPTNFFLKILLR